MIPINYIYITVTILKPNNLRFFYILCKFATLIPIL